MPKILFVNAVNTAYQIQGYLPPLGLGYLAASIRQHFGKDYFDIKIIDRNVEETIQEWQPEIVGITSVSENWNIAKRYAKIANANHAVVIVGGMHVSALYETMTEDMHTAIIGEGELAICDILELGTILYREPIDNLDELPMPARDLFPHNGIEHIFTARGCPYRCTFCASSRYWSKLRYFSPEYVVREISELVNIYHARHIEIWDDLFIADKKRLFDIAIQLDVAGITKQVDFICQARANLMNEHTVETLKAMNVVSVGMGLESGCARTLEYLKGHSVTVEDNKRAIELLRKHGLKACGSFIIGSPQETRAEILQTLDFIKQSDLASFDVHLLTPLPGTPVWDYALSRGLVSNDMDFSRLGMAHGDNIDNSIILSETMERDELKELYGMFMQEKQRRKVRNVMRNPLLLVQYAGEAKGVVKRVLSGKSPFSQ
jgi:anaerobic magnesium-protoporphyrin IX monomethyl ester cyclase